MRYIKDRYFYFFFLLIPLLHFLAYKFLGWHFAFSYDNSQYATAYLSAIKTAWGESSGLHYFSEMFFGVPLLFAGSYDFKINLLLPFFSVMDSIMIHGSYTLLIGSFGFYFMARKLFNFSELASFLGAIVYCFNPFVIWYLYDTGMNPNFFWVPWQVLAVTKVFRSPLLSLTILGISSLDQILTGRFQSIEASLFTVIGTLILYYRFSLNLSWKAVLRKAYKNGGVFFLVFLVCLLIASPFLYDQFTVIGSSARAANGMDGVKYPWSIINLFGVFPLVNKFIPWTSNGIGYGAYVGFFFLFFTVFAYTYKDKALNAFVKVAFWSSVVVLLFIFNLQIFGIELFDDIFKLLPGHGGLRYTRRYLPLFFMLFSLCMMRGVDLLTLSKQPPEAAKKLLLKFEVFILVLLIGVFFWGRTSEYFLWAVVLLLSNSVLFRSLSVSSKYRKSLILLGGFFYLGTTVLWNHFEHAKKPIDFYEAWVENQVQPQFVDYLKDQEKYSFRIYDSSAYDNLNDSMSTSYIRQGFESIGGYHTLVSKDLIDLFTEVLNVQYLNKLNIAELVESNRLSLLNLKYIISSDKHEYYDIKKLKPARNILNSKNYSLYKLDKSVERVYVTNVVDYTENSKQSLSTMNELFDIDRYWPLSRLVVEGDPPSQKREGKNFYQTPSRLEAKRGMFNFQVNTDAPGWAVLVEHFNPRHWSATVNSKPAVIHRANAAFMAVKIPEGESEVRFVYGHPAYLFKLSILGLICLLGIGTLIKLFVVVRAKA